MTTQSELFDPTAEAMLADVHAGDSPRSLYIDGRWEAASDNDTRTIVCPADGTVVGSVSEASEKDTLRAIAVARATFDKGEWGSVPASERGKILLRVAALIRERTEIFAKAESADTGKRLEESEADMSDIANAFEYFCTLAGHNAGRVVDAGDDNVRSRIAVEPVGVCGLITPWNYPLLQVSWKVAPAIAAGNTFVLKQAELTPHTAMLLMAALEEAGLPAGVGNLITGSGAACGNPLSQSPDVDMVSFTGGLETGKIIARNAADTVKRVALELGGKNPNIVFADADFDAAIDNALSAAFFHSGQVCSAGARLIVEESIHDDFVDELVRRADNIRLGGPTDPRAETGPIISTQQRDKIDNYVQRAREQGATIRCGGRAAEAADTHSSHGTGNSDLGTGIFYLPTVIDGATGDMDCVHDEAFGPTVTVETFSTEDEAITIGNDTTYGLAGAVWTSDIAKAERVVARLRHGTVWINDFHPYLPQAEWGGFKQSGNGRELGPSGLAEYQEVKHIYHNIAPAVTGQFGLQ
ncbi:aldehyde dehydrogenase family protein [Corynebacterium incognita]|uniref:Aldehyde dehydrogenase family protein n=2 Tax=Corynebacterium incognita TaxID=2754725 RepID=A0A7G7CS21_9CORY|nr:aldehyde dehydrogenase family protein [Corynebacterium incognita]QNE90387.1 aldehyde dehydrogenase family protein [Corynebacterium incognita]